MFMKMSNAFAFNKRNAPDSVNLMIDSILAGNNIDGWVCSWKNEPKLREN